MTKAVTYYMTCHWPKSQLSKKQASKQATKMFKINLKNIKCAMDNQIILLVENDYRHSPHTTVLALKIARSQIRQYKVKLEQIYLRII